MHSRTPTEEQLSPLALDNPRHWIPRQLHSWHPETSLSAEDRLREFGLKLRELCASFAKSTVSTARCDAENHKEPRRPCQGQRVNDLVMEQTAVFPLTFSTDMEIQNVAWSANDVPFSFATTNSTMRMRSNIAWNDPVETFAFPDGFKASQGGNAFFTSKYQAARDSSMFIVADADKDNWETFEIEGTIISFILRDEMLVVQTQTKFMLNAVLAVYKPGADSWVPFISPQEVVVMESSFSGLSAGLSVDGTIVYLAVDDTIVLYDISVADTITVLANTTLPAPQTGPLSVNEILTDPTGKWVVFGSLDGYWTFCKVVDSNLEVATGFYLPNLAEDGVVSSNLATTFSPDGKYLVIPTTTFLGLDFSPESLAIIDMSLDIPAVVYHDIIQDIRFPNAFRISFNPTDSQSFILLQRQRPSVGIPFISTASTWTIKESSGIEQVTETTTSDPDSAGALQNVTDDNCSNACFPASATVELTNGRKVPMSELQIGEAVRVGPEQFSEVFLWTHRMAGQFRFVSLSTDAGHLEASASHLVYTSRGMIPAGAVRVGDDLLDGRSGARRQVKRIDLVWESGLYNPQTLHGDIVVENFAVSTYTSALPAWVSHGMLAPIRMSYWLTGFSLLGRTLEQWNPLEELAAFCRLVSTTTLSIWSVLPGQAVTFI